MQISVGPIYKESNFDALIVEPWAVFTNLLFLAVIIYWSYKIKGHSHNHKFLKYSLPVLLIGFIGGTMFHATRGNPIWLLMDFLPIVILTLSASVYFFRKIKTPWYKIVLIFFIPFLIIPLAIIIGIPSQIFVNLIYFILATIVISPIAYYIIKIKSKYWKYITYSLVSFLIALFFRYYDLQSSLSMGTHWLWHIFGAISVHFLIIYIYKDKIKR